MRRKSVWLQNFHWIQHESYIRHLSLLGPNPMVEIHPPRSPHSPASPSLDSRNYYMLDPAASLPRKLRPAVNLMALQVPLGFPSGNLTITTPTSDPSILTPSTQVLPTLRALSCPQPYPLSRVREVFAFSPVCCDDAGHNTAVRVGVIRVGVMSCY